MNRRNRIAALAVILCLASVGGARAENDCAANKTLQRGKLTIATGNPAYFPWVIDDKPETGKGFEAAVALEAALRLGFSSDRVNWVRTTFDQAIQPGPKQFDFNIQQYSITPERERFIDFSSPYYEARQAVVVRESAVKAGAKPELASLRVLRFGAIEGATQQQFIQSAIHPASTTLIYADLADSIEALKAEQIDAVVLDFPTALYTTSVTLDDGVVLGQFPHADAATTGATSFGMVFEKGNKLRDCVNDVLAAMGKDGTLKKFEAEWLQTATDVPLIK